MAKFSFCFGNVFSPCGGVHRELMDINHMPMYTYKDLQTATQNFNRVNKIRHGEFGSVYKGQLKDGKLVAIKVLSSESVQGLREVIHEITFISDIQHENLVKLHGYCVEKDHRILVYGYLKNGSLDRTLLDGEDCSIKFTWEIRRKICIGVARGLAYLHEELHPPIIHGGIKAKHILLDEDFTPKITDFGLAQILTSDLARDMFRRLAGKGGYWDPEYLNGGQITTKSDIYSFGFLLLEIVSERCNIKGGLRFEEQYILARAWKLYREGKLERSIDASIGNDDDVTWRN